MVILERRLLGVFRYRKVYFPTVAAISDLVSKMAINDILRFYYPGGVLKPTRHLVERSPFSTVIVDLRESLEALMAAMDRRDCRRPLRRAEQMSGRVRIAECGETASADFLTLYNGLARAKGRMQGLWARNLRRYLAAADLRVLYLDGRPMCGHVTLCDGESRRAVGVFTANRRLESAEDGALCGALNRYLHWHEMQQYKARGVEWYDFGGIGHEAPRQTKFNRFRISFGGEIVSGNRYTFAGVGGAARLCLHAYERLGRSPMAWATPHV